MIILHVVSIFGSIIIIVILLLLILSLPASASLSFVSILFYFDIKRTCRHVLTVRQKITTNHGRYSQIG